MGLVGDIIVGSVGILQGNLELFSTGEFTGEENMTLVCVELTIESVYTALISQYPTSHIIWNFMDSDL